MTFWKFIFQTCFTGFKYLCLMFWEVHEDDNNQSHLIRSWDTVLAVIKWDITAYFPMIKITHIKSQLLITCLARLMSLIENPNNLPLRLFLKEVLVDRLWCMQQNRFLILHFESIFSNFCKPWFNILSCRFLYAT